MEYRFSDRVKELKPSAIREIFKYASDPEFLPLSAGNPAPEAFPAREIAEISAKIFAERPIEALQYNITEGYLPLREYLTDYLKKRHGVGREFDGVLITSGAQQVMDLAAKSLLNEGDAVLCEEPSFIGSLNTFRSYRARLRGVPMEPDGMDMDALERALREEKNVKLIYTIPNFQNPTGVTMSAEKRRRMIALAERYGVMILEDNPYGDLRFAGRDEADVKSLDETGAVLYAGTFSKVIAPGLRVGWAAGPKELLQKMVVCKQGEDVHTNIWAQMVCYELAAHTDFDAHLGRLRAIYRRKAKAAEEALGRFLPPEVTHRPIEGGLFFWCTLPERIGMPEFCRRAIERKVGVVPGSAFLTDDSAPCRSFRINYTTPSDDKFAQGAKILGDLAREMLA